MLQLFNTLDNCLFLGIRTDNFLKAKKGTPEYAKWILEWRAKWGNTHKLKEATKLRQAATQVLLKNDLKYSHKQEDILSFELVDKLEDLIGIDNSVTVSTSKNPDEKIIEFFFDGDDMFRFILNDKEKQFLITHTFTKNMRGNNFTAEFLRQVYNILKDKGYNQFDVLISHKENEDGSFNIGLDVWINMDL